MANSEPPVVAAIIHDLAGMLSNVAAFAGILEARPDHPSRAEFLPVMAKEARAAAEAVKDLQLARSLSEPWPRGDLQLVEVPRVLKQVAEHMGVPGWLDPQIETLGGDALRITVDDGVLSGLLARSLRVAAADDLTAPSNLRVESDENGAVFSIDLSSTSYEGDVAADLPRGRRELRPLALLCAVNDSWGGTSRVDANDDRICLVLHLNY
ncbi:MAG: hypothetical protein QOH90_216 [Actinomycetota bacterium]|nr:hypothetical protein [Actinomycetota bacterium]